MFRYFLAGVGILGMLALAGFLLTRYGAAQRNAGQQEERVAWQDKVAANERHIADLRAANERRVVEAQTRYIERTDTVIQPVEIRSKEMVVQYAQTPAGAARCLSAERVLGIQADRAALFPAAALAPAGGAGPLPPDAPASPGFDQR